MKILHVTKKYPNALGGDAVVVANLEKQQRLNSNEVTILTSNCDEIINKPHVYKYGLKDTPAALDGITIKRLLSLIMLFFTAYKILRKQRPTIIHTHSIDMAFFISFAARHYKIPIVHTFHIVTFYDTNHSALRRKTELLFARGARPALVTAPNEYDVTRLIGAGLAASVLPNGIDLDFWQSTNQANVNKIFTFVTMGRLEAQKGYQYLIEAASRLRFRCKVVIIGDGSLKSDLKNQLASVETSNEIQFVGPKNPKEIRKLVNSADAAVFPSLYETTPITLLEAWALHKPVIITAVGIARQQSVSKKSAMVIPARNSTALCEAMDEMISNKMLRQSLVQNGTSEVEKYTWQNVAFILKHYYDQALI